MSVARSAGHERDFFDGLSFEEQDEQSEEGFHLASNTRRDFC